ncbi:MAG: hypothetical protein WBP12_00890 [Candidatus Saccharimonas sp.]
MYTLKSIARRGSMLGAAFAVVAAAVVPSIPVSADALNPLTERSLTLSSSSPGWAYTDGSGNATYAPPNSGANGQKTGNYFDFKVSSTDTVNAMSFQYCTTSAGNCNIPGNDVVRGTDTATTTDLRVTYPSAVEISGTSAAGTGTITVTNASTAVTGSGTSFLSAFKPGSSFKTAGGATYQIASIASNTALTLKANATATETGVAFSTSDFGTIVDPANGNVKAVPGYTNNNAKYQAQGGTGDPAEAAKTVAGNFIVMHKVAGVWTQSTGWSVTAHNVDNGTGITNNYIVASNDTGVALTAGDQVKVLFFATATNYITNPGEGAFFVKINTYSVPFEDSLTPTAPAVNLSGFAPSTDANIIDGGVTVANVMNQSIQITTKVLETMEFSVGTVDPDTLTSAQVAASDIVGANHKPCNRILTRFSTSDTDRNVLQLGNQGAESSLETGKAYATHSYWRLSSNSSGGATVYYSGHTLSNTSGDEIAAIGTAAKHSAPGSEQFGLAIATTALSGSTSGTNDTTPSFNTGLYGVNYAQDRSGGGLYENGADNDIQSLSNDLLTTIGGTYTGAATRWAATDPDWNYANLNKSYHTPRLDPLAPLENYGGGSGKINSDSDSDLGTNEELGPSDDDAAFAFDTLSDTVPRAIASETSQVVDCVTAKMRYVANIAATTPAGIYTTKINYIAAPQY